MLIFSDWSGLPACLNFIYTQHGSHSLARAYLDIFLIRQLLGLHFLKHFVFVVVLRIVDARDRDPVVDALTVHDPC